jgi:Cdc6-like AAA superfamily ATPase
METLVSWFGLKDGHKDFFISNDSDARLLFARQELDTQLQTILRKSFRTSNPPKFVLYGDWGVGKTHTMHHISHVVQNTPGYDAQIVFIELPDINAKSTFQVAHAALLDALGLNTVKNWMIQFQTRHQSAALPTIQKATQSEDIAKAFLSLPTFGDTARLSWEWLRGATLNGNDARSAGLPASLEQSNQFAAVLRVLGRLCQEIDGKILILMMDEATKLEDVTTGDAIHHWLNAFKILSDDSTKELGCIVSASFRDPDDMPEMLSSAQVRSRFGERHYIMLQNFSATEADAFLRGLLSEWIEPERRSQLREQFAVESDGEEVPDATYPFTNEAFSRFVDYVVRNGGISTPRDIQKSLDDIANQAVDDGRHIISADYLNSLFAAI